MYYTADVIKVTDYYPFGWGMPGRRYNQGDYRYGFQGQEMDNEIKGIGNAINYKYRMHDPRIGRFFAKDPLFKKYPYYSPYAFSGNRVVDMVEQEGLQPGEPGLIVGFTLFTVDFKRISANLTVAYNFNYENTLVYDFTNIKAKGIASVQVYDVFRPFQNVSMQIDLKLQTMRGNHSTSLTSSLNAAFNREQKTIGVTYGFTPSIERRWEVRSGPELDVALISEQIKFPKSIKFNRIHIFDIDQKEINESTVVEENSNGNDDNQSSCADQSSGGDQSSDSDEPTTRRNISTSSGMGSLWLNQLEDERLGLMPTSP